MLPAFGRSHPQKKYVKKKNEREQSYRWISMKLSA
jgi:hypothetical protein